MRDLDAFFASVEQRDDPRLRGRPVIVGGGVVLAASYEAKAYGIHSAMGGGRARRLCPHAVVVRPRFSAYSEASKAVYRVFDDTTPLVEGLSIDEAFLDVRGMERLAGTPAEIAARLKRNVLERVGPSDHGRRGENEVSREGRERGREARRSPRRAAGSRARVPASARGRAPLGRRACDGRASSGRAGSSTVGQVAQLGEESLVSLLGPGAGRHLHALARNRDPRAVRVGRRRGSVGSPARARAHAEDRRGGRRSARLPRRPRHPSAARRDTGWGARSSCDCASTTSRGRRGRTRCRLRLRTPRRSSERRGGSTRARRR